VLCRVSNFYDVLLSVAAAQSKILVALADQSSDVTFKLILITKQLRDVTNRELWW
jgi:hypothetical protein